MTEAEWLALKDVPWVFSNAHSLVKFSRRKATLFGVACVRATPGIGGQRRLLKAVAEAEKAADTGKWAAVARLFRAADAACWKVKQGSARHYWALAARRLTDESLAMLWPELAGWLSQAADASGRRTRGLRRAYVALLHDIRGNPLRPVAFDPSWGTDTVVSLARGMYESRDFSAMPILADALQDAGCDNEDVLNHCRDEKQPHVRGCWVVDLVLGKA